MWNSARWRRVQAVAISTFLLAGLSPATAQTDGDFKGVIGLTARESKPWYAPPRRPAPGSPNVVYIVIDDAGFSDFGAFGSEIATPNIDALAQSGLRYNNFHTEAICSPSRAALLTGRDSHAVGVGNVTELANGFPENTGHITHAAATLAEMLRADGYATFGVGKWHLVPPADTTAAGPYDQWPLQRGFDRFYGFLGAFTDQYHPELVSDNTRIDTPARPDYRLSVDLADHAIGDILSETAADPRRPFFLYLAFGAVHTPHQAPKALIDKYVPVFAKGWDETRADRLARQKSMGIVPAGTIVHPRNPGIPAWDSLTPTQQTLYTRHQATFAGYLEDADTQIGRVIAALKQTGRLDNTIIVVISDNGASPEGDSDGSFNQIKTYNNSNSIETRYGLDLSAYPAFQSHPADVAADTQKMAEAGSETSYDHYPAGWAMAGNTPFPFYKLTVWGGGERDPLIVSWPDRIKQAGQVRSQFVDIIDITPTILDVTGLQAPRDYQGVPQMPLHGKSIAATFDDARAANPRDTQYFELWGQRAIWHDGWKAIATHVAGTPFDRDRWSLFDLGQDFSEVHDVAAANPDRLRQLQNMWWVEAARYGALPLDDRSAGDIFAAADRLGAPKPSRYTYYPGQDHLPAAAVPSTLNKSYAITATVDCPDSATQGVLLSVGDRFGGFVLYVKDQKLIFDYNDFGRHTVIASNTAVPIGPATLKYTFTRTGDYTGTGQLTIDGNPVGAAAITGAGRIWVGYSGLDVGRTAVSPVSEAYRDLGAFAFPARALKKVVFDVP